MKPTPMRPFFKHYGSKWILAGSLPPPLPGLPIIEPFAGGAGYSVRYGAGRRVMLYDIDPDTVAIWEYLLGASQADILSLPVFADRTDIRTLGLERGPMLMIQRWLTSQGSNSNWRMTPSVLRLITKHPGSFWSSRTRGRVAEQLPLISRWSVTLADYARAPDIEATWQIDPPYQSNREAQVAYGKTSGCDYSDLAKWCRSRRGAVYVHEQAGASWLPFRSFVSGAVTGRISDGVRKRQC